MSDEILALITEFRVTLVNLGHYGQAQVDQMTGEEVLRNSVRILKEYNSVCVAAGASLIHVTKVFESMADRGAYPAELLPSQPQYCGIQGYAHIKNCVKAMLPLINHKIAATQKDEK